MTDTIQLAAQNKYRLDRWADSLKEPDKRTGDEIAADVIENLGLKFGDEIDGHFYSGGEADS